MNIKVKATYCLEKVKTQQVLEENSGCLAIAYYDDGDRAVITNVVAEEITDAEVTFRYLDDDKTITILIDKIIDWIC